MLNLSDNPRGGTFCASCGTLAIGDGAKTGPAITVTTHYSIDGYGYVYTGAATVRPLTAATVQPVLTKCLYLICADADGAISSVQGVPVLTAELTAGARVLNWPELPAGKCAIGAVKVETQSTATFTPGTTALDAANIVETYYNFVGGIPVKPLAS